MAVVVAALVLFLPIIASAQSTLSTSEIVEKTAPAVVVIKGTGDLTEILYQFQ